MRIPILQAFCLAASLTIPAIAQSPEEPVVAFATGTTLVLASASGQVTQRVGLGHPLYNFALSSDRKLIVVVAPNTATGGSLSLLDLQTHRQTRLTSGNLYFKASELDKGETEVYDDPQFSPDRRSLAFAIHTDNPGDGNDAINILDGVEGMAFCHFEEGDVVRHPLVQRIVRAYESAKPQQQELPLEGAITVGGAAREEQAQAPPLHATKPQ